MLIYCSKVFSNKKQTNPLSSSELCSRSAAEHHKLTMTMELIHVGMCMADLCTCISVWPAAGRGCWTQQSEAERKSKHTVVGDNGAIKQHVSGNWKMTMTHLDVKIEGYFFLSRRHEVPFQLLRSTQTRRIKKKWSQYPVATNKQAENVLQRFHG